MSQATGNGPRRAVGRVLGGVSAALLFAAAIIQPEGPMPMMAAGPTMALGISAPCSGSEASSHHRFGGVMAIPSFPSMTTATIPTIGITATIPAPAITATIPTLATAFGPTPTPDRLGTIAPGPPAIIHL